MNATVAAMAPQLPTLGRWHTVISALLAALLGLLWMAGYGPGGSACKAPIAIPAVTAPAAPAVPPVVEAPAPAPVAAAPIVAAAPEAPPAAKVYFALDKTNVPGDTDNTLAKVVAYLKANPGAKAVVSGFHDPTGNRAHNEDLALNRARAVRAELEKAGIANDRVVMARPTETTGTGNMAEARRVEVAVQQ